MKKIIKKLSVFLGIKEIVFIDPEDKLSFNLLGWLLEKTPERTPLVWKKVSPKLLKRSQRAFLIFKKNSSPKFKKLVKKLRPKDYLVSPASKNKVATKAIRKNYAVGSKAEVMITDLIREKEITSFKAEFDGHLVPFRIKGKWSKNELESLASVIAFLVAAKFNLVQVSKELKNFDKHKKES